MTQRPSHRPWLKTTLGALLGHWALSALAQVPLVPSTPPSTSLVCTSEVGTSHLYGQWRLTLLPASGAAVTGDLRFERHPKYADSVRGQWRDPKGVVHLLSGDLTDGELVLDESTDGTAISAIWVGHPVACGQGFDGERRMASPDESSGSSQRFELRRSTGWD